MNNINELYEISVLHDTYNKHEFNIPIDPNNDNNKMCQCGKIIMEYKWDRMYLTRESIKKINEYFNVKESDLIKHLAKINNIDIEYELFSKQSKNDMFEIFKSELEKNERRNIFNFNYHKKVKILKDYLSIDFFKKLNIDKSIKSFYIEQFILSVPQKATSKDFNIYLKKHVNENLHDLLTLDLDKIKQINKIKGSEKYFSKLSFNYDSNNLKSIYKDKYFFDKMYHIEKIMNKDFNIVDDLDGKALLEFRMFYIAKESLTHVFRSIAIKANMNRIKTPESFKEYLIQNAPSEIDKQAAKQVKIKEMHNNSSSSHIFSLDDKMYEYEYNLSDLRTLYKYA